MKARREEMERMLIVRRAVAKGGLYGGGGG
jgi:hypothetical protein